MLQIRPCEYTRNQVIHLSIDVRRLPKLICVSETKAYAQINRFSEQINYFSQTEYACQHLSPNDSPD